ncbi:CRISPR-associated protein [Thiocapsa imhoffii]|uniref:CRISPR-associated protein n=1 Tax=Thiocapsa imhoffii TaxID=382777 RepID=A0A9X0WIP7_9GAMM|nr:putative CRISPR-associated protein [Thiocapsa imhoffii]MBK1645220.1 CRISPR-associated protein [Thiocapsa imhoffii]
MAVYLCTCGTSAAKKLFGQPTPFNAAWVAEHGGVEAAAKAIHDTFRTARMDDDVALKRDLSAEIHSLARMGVNDKDTVVLFSSETADGQACAGAVQRYLEQVRAGIVCRVEVVPGLQVTDAHAFRTQGVLNFTKAVLDAIDANGAAQCVLNPTGGFKSLVPYTVLIGMLRGVPAKYIFEQSSALIPLPMMPVEFARSRLEPLRPLLERIQNETAIPRAALDQALPSFEEREILESLFEDQGQGQVSLSPVGFLVWEELERPTALVPFLSRRALDDLLKIRATEGTAPDDYIARAARSPEQLAVGKHEPWSNGLFWLKRGEHTRDRYLVSVEGWRLLVWRIVDHDEYDRLLTESRKRDVGARVAAERRVQYAPFIRMELYED